MGWRRGNYVLTDEWKRRRWRPTHLVRPEGRCRTCGVRLSGRRTAYCSDDCERAFVSVWWGREAPHWLRMHVFIRDGYACQDCGFVALVPWWVKAMRATPEDDRIAARYGLKERRTQLAGEYLVGRRPDWSKLEMHHIVPVAEGGRETDDNLITLCADCHKRRHGRRDPAQEVGQLALMED